MLTFRGGLGGIVRVLCVWIVLLPAIAVGEVTDLAKVVPADAMVYIGWAGHDHTKVAGKNTALGKTIADPQVQALIDAVRSAIDTAIKERVIGPPQYPLYESAKHILSALYRHPTAFVLIDADMGEQGPTVNAALISRMGKDAGEVVKHVDTILAAVGLVAPSNGPDQGGLRRIPLPLPVGVFYGAVDGDFVVTIGEYTASVLTPYLRGEGAALASSESLARARTKFGGNDETRAVSVYVDTAAIKKRVEKLLPMFTGGDPDALAAYAGFMEHSGYGLIKSFCWEMHHRDGGCYNGVYIHTGEKPTGVLGILANEPITDKELALIPLGVNWAMAFRMGSEKWFDQMLGYMTTLSPEGEAEILGGVALAEEMLGFRLGGDFLDLINDAVIVYDAPEDGGLLITGMIVIFKASDTDRFVQSVKRVASLISEQVSDGNVAMKISGFTHRGHEIEFVNVTGIPMPVAPAWSTHDGWIILGLYPQIVRNAIDRILDGDPKKDSILADADFNRARKLLGGVGSMVQYCNTKRAAEDAYAFLLPLAQTGLAMAQSEGVALDISVMPSRKALTQHLFGDLQTMRTDDEGILYASFGPLPVPIPAVGGSSVGVAALAVSILLPSLSRARNLSKRVVSAANLKDIGTSCMIYANDHEEQFPPTLRTLVAQGDIAPGQLESPRHVPGIDCYVYLAGQTAASDLRNILVHERMELNDGEGVNVLFVDGSVRFVGLPEFEQLLRETTARLEGE